jgi:branched-chain amino acid transport system permease protein
MAGAFMGYYLAKLVPSDTMLGGLAVLGGSMIGCAILGMAIERFAYRPLRGAPTLNVLITAIGVSLLLEYTGQVFFGAAPRTFPPVFPERIFTVHGIVISSSALAVIVVAGFLMVALEIIVHRTKIGTAMRALSLNPQAAQLVGINNNIVISFTFGLGSALAAAGGILYDLNYPSIDPLMAAVLGGIGSIPGAALGGLVLGTVETFVGGSEWSTYKDAIAFAVLILILLFRPGGLLGRSTIEKV